MSPSLPSYVKEFFYYWVWNVKSTQTGSEFAPDVLQSEARTISERTRSDGVSRHLGLYFDLEKLNFSNLPYPEISLNLARSTGPAASPLSENPRPLGQPVLFPGLEPEISVCLPSLWDPPTLRVAPPNLPLPSHLEQSGEVSWRAGTGNAFKLQTVLSTIRVKISGYFIESIFKLVNVNWGGETCFQTDQESSVKPYSHPE